MPRSVSLSDGCVPDLCRIYVQLTEIWPNINDVVAQKVFTARKIQFPNKFSDFTNRGSKIDFVFLHNLVVEKLGVLLLCPQQQLAL